MNLGSPIAANTSSREEFLVDSLPPKNLKSVPSFSSDSVATEMCVALQSRTFNGAEVKLATLNSKCCRLSPGQYRSTYSESSG